jgi:hypothetical protein
VLATTASKTETTSTFRRHSSDHVFLRSTESAYATLGDPIWPWG